MSGQDGDQIQQHVWETHDTTEMKCTSFRIFEMMEYSGQSTEVGVRKSGF